MNQDRVTNYFLSPLRIAGNRMMVPLWLQQCPSSGAEKELRKGPRTPGAAVPGGHPGLREVEPARRAAHRSHSAEV